MSRVKVLVPVLRAIGEGETGFGVGLIANVYFLFPVLVAVAHNGVGALLLLSVVTLNYYLFTAKLR